MPVETHVSAVAAYIVDVPLKTAVETAHGVFTHQRSVVAKVELKNGIRGWGEANPVAGFSEVSADEIAAEIVRAADAFIGVDIHDKSMWRQRITLLRHGRLPVEMALLDATARALGQPLNMLLGAPLRHEIPLSGWIGWGSAAEAADLAAQLCRLGFAGLKIKIGSGADTDLERVSAVRAAVGPEMRLIVDAGEAYEVDSTISLLRRLEPLNISACEQPVSRHDLHALARIRLETGVPLILDESVGTISDLDRAVNAGAVDIIKLKLIKHEGLEAALALGLAAAERGVGCTVGHGFALGLTTLAEGHIASVLPNFVPPGEMVGPLKMKADVALPAPDLHSGRLVLSGEPGLGAIADSELLGREAA